MLFRTRLIAAFMTLAALALVQAGIAAWSFERALAKVESGRVAADLHSGFWGLAEAQHRIERALLAMSVVFDAEARSGPGLAADPGVSAEPVTTRTATAALRGAWADFSDRVAKLQRLQDEVLRVQHPDAIEAEALEARARVLARLEALAAQLAALDAAALDGADVDALTMRAVLEQDASRWLAEAAQAERALALHQRAEADRLLERVSWIGGLAVLLLVAAALTLAAVFVRALQRPFEAVGRAVVRFRAGDFAHRVEADLPGEFAPLARQMNAMAEALAAQGRDQALARAALADELAERNRALAQALDDLHAVEQRRRQFLADLSHELRTPATSIRGEAEIALRRVGRPEDDYRAALQRILADGEQLSLVISDLLTMARSDTTEWPREMSEIDPVKPLAAVLERVRSRIEAKGLSLATDLPPGSCVRADARRLEQVFSIVLDNAVHYSLPGGSIRVTSRQEGDHWCAEIRDDGIGFEPGELDRVFDRHYRGRRARELRPDGEGLGLAIARMLARMHGGHLELLSANDAVADPAARQPEASGEPHAVRGAVARLCLPLCVPA